MDRVCFFILLEISAAQLFDQVLVHVPKDRATVTCSQDSALLPGVQWLVNGSALENLNLSNVSEVYSEQLQNGFLTLNDLTLEYNMTTISCTANTFSGMTILTNVLLLMQGLLPAVSSPVLIVQSMYAVTLTWTAPFSLDITRFDPDIIGYCVNVVSSSMTLHSECGITETEFSYQRPGCNGYTFTVIPVNIVGNGTGISLYYPPEVQAPGVLLELIETDSITFTIIMSAPVCQAELAALDIDTGETTIIGVSNFNIIDTNITFRTQQLARNRHYNITVTASNIDEQTATSGIMISTHDIQSLQINLNTGSLIAIYSEHSLSVGSLFIIVFVSENGAVNFTRSTYWALNRTVHLHYTLPFAGHYRVFVYDIEHDGMLQNGLNYPAATGELSTLNDEKGFVNSLVSDCEINAFGYLITVNCAGTFSFQIIAQLSDLRKVHKLYTNRTIDNQTTTSIVVEENGLYHITIFIIRNDLLGILDSDIQHGYQLIAATYTSTTASAMTTTSSSAMDLTSAVMEDMEVSTNLIIILGLGVGIGLFVILAMALSLVVLYKKTRGKKPKERTNVNQEHLYEEIKVDATGRIVLNSSAPALSKGVKKEVAESDAETTNSYKITQCLAYEVPSKVEEIKK